MDDDASKVAIPIGATRLVTSPKDAQVIVWNRETDCRNALTRGIKEYFEQLSIVWTEGRQLSFAQSFSDWADAEDDADYPAFIAYTVTEGTYDASNMSPSPQTVQIPDGTKRYVRQTSEFQVPVHVDVWCNDSESRTGIIAMLEDASNPVDWMYGFRLKLPHYWGVHATFEKVSSIYLDDPDKVYRRWRIASITYNAALPEVVGIGKIADFNPTAKTNVVVSSQTLLGQGQR